MTNYRIMFANGNTLSFDYPSDLDLHKLDKNQPFVFDNVWINLSEVAFIEKAEASYYEE